MTARPKVLSITPLFVVSNLQRSIDFYCDRLGFQDPAVWGEPPCFAMINRDQLDLMLSLAGEAKVQPNGPSGAWDMFIRVADIEKELEALRAGGVEIVRGPETAFYNMREIEVLDPDGYRICLAQNVTPE